MDKICCLTTIDNPFDIFEDFRNWFIFDIEKGYNSCSKVARVAKYSESMSQVESDRETERAIDEIIKNDITHMFKKVYSDT